jgi:3-hydroxy-9,10-secoandrosta-1,3,5(10)-triene-9,17-dione monooxygenase
LNAIDKDPLDAVDIDGICNTRAGVAGDGPDRYTHQVRRDELIDRARQLIPTLQDRAPEAERIRRLPEQTHKQLLDADLYRIYLPRRYGGAEHDFQLQVDIAAELGRGCGSTAWVWSIVASHHWVQGMMDVRAQDDVWGSDPEALIASAFPGRGSTATAVDGGFVLDGMWSFSSGIDICQWVQLTIMVKDGDGPPHQRFALMSTSDGEVVDDWHVAGLRGTGSKSLRLQQVFLPAYRTLDSRACLGQPTPGSAVNPGALYRMPLFALFGHGIVGPAVGIARGALDTVLESMRSRRSVAGVALAEQPTVGVRLAEASAEIDAARALLRAASEEGTAAAEAGVQPALTDRVRWRRNAAYAATLCVRAVQRLQPLFGGGGLADDTPTQRAFRDVHAVAAHIALTWDVQAANYGGVLLGAASTDPKL